MLKTRTIVALLALALVLGPTTSAGYAKASTDPELAGPYDVSSITVTLTSPSTGDDLETDIYYPSDDGSRVDPSGVPYPTLVFARGFFSFAATYTGWGEHLASWGYIVGIPDFPSEDQEDRASDIQHLISYLEAENVRGASTFFESIDVDRLGLAGHSKGGMSTLIVAARDDRIKAGVALDPAGMDEWDYEAEAPDIEAPMAVLGAPSQMCNNSAEYNDVFPRVGAMHKALYVITDGSHCDFMNTDDALQVQLCGILCGAASEERLALTVRYTTAWLNYYLQHNTDYYAYLYGAHADADVADGLISRDAQTAPRDVTATGGDGAVALGWTLYDHPVVAGYNIYRTQVSGDYADTPSGQVGPVSAYLDSDVTVGERYYYLLVSRDGAGHEHQLSDEVSAVPRPPAPTASFDASPTDCCVPLTVVFTDTSIADTSMAPANTIETWEWQFGDATGMSTDQHPTHTYEEPGVYTVTLTVTDSQGESASEVRTDLIEANPVPAAGFDASPADGCAPLTVTFTDTSVADASLLPSNAIQDWHWAFGDGSGQSGDRHPTYTYHKAGTYTVTLTVTDAHGCASTLARANAAAAHPLPGASFDASPADCCAPLTVIFTDTSVADASLVPANAIESWHWQFGDGMESSTDQHPTHIYEQSGVYTVTLTVTDTHGCSGTAMGTSAITVHPPPAASFEVDPSVGEAPLEVAFIDASVADTSIVADNTIETWSWDFGDGAGNSSDQHPTYTYEEPGSYAVTLTVADSHGCYDEVVDSVTVVDAFDSFIYLPMVTRDGDEEPRALPKILREPRALARPLWTRARHLIRELPSRLLDL